jgi:hypothetical protein
MRLTNLQGSPVDIASMSSGEQAGPAYRVGSPSKEAHSERPGFKQSLHYSADQTILSASHANFRSHPIGVDPRIAAVLQPHVAGQRPGHGEFALDQTHGSSRFLVV